MEIFNIKGKKLTLEQLYAEIYDNSKTKSAKIQETFDTVSKFITDIGSAVNLLPEVTKLQQVAVNNDDQLIKLASIVTKLQKAGKNSDDGDYELTEEERKQIMEIAKRTVSDQPGGSK